VTIARRLAYEVLRGVERGEFAETLLLKRLRGLDARDAGLATELVFGVLRRRAQLDWLISRVSSRLPSALDPAVLESLRLAAYQLRFLDRIPPHAAVSESVELVRRANKASAAGFVNAVLRKLPPLPESWPSEEIEFSLPSGLLDRWRRHYGGHTRAIASAFLERPKSYIRVPSGQSPPAGAEATDVPGAFLVDGEPPAGFARQDIGAQAVVPHLDLRPGCRFLDVCAAPGNKTMQAMEASPTLAVACDSSASRLADLLVSGAARLRVDAASGLPFGPVFDRILVDAPCSGTGTLGRNPEIRWRVSLPAIARHAERQQLILREALRCLAPGGLLVYSTCSLEREENEDVVNAVAPGRVRHMETRLPGVCPGDGFFTAVIT
jgi:16S rRNA (cytosine967-C5)-methyltransferase